MLSTNLKFSSSKKLFLGILVTSLLVSCSDAPKPVSTNSTSSQTASSGYGAQPANTPSPDSVPALPSVPENIQVLEKKYSSKPTDIQIKNELTKAKLEYGNSLMTDASLPPRVKYRAALKMYREVLQLDPENLQAEQNKNQIEEIYKQMGRPIPTPD